MKLEACQYFTASVCNDDHMCMATTDWTRVITVSTFTVGVAKIGINLFFNRPVVNQIFRGAVSQHMCFSLYFDNAV